MPDATASNPVSDRFRELEPVPSPMSTEEWAAVEPAVRNGAFFSAGVEDAHLLEALRQNMDRAIAEGWTQQEFIAAMTRWLREHVDPATGRPYIDDEAWEKMTAEERDAHERKITNIDSVVRLKLIFRTQAEVASGWNQFRHEMSPERLRKYPGWEFYRKSGAKTFRKDHVAHQGEIRLKTDFDYWMARNSADQGGFQNPFPPFGFNSWMWVLEVDRDECEDLGLLKRGEPAPMPDARYAPWLPGAVGTQGEPGKAAPVAEPVRPAPSAPSAPTRPQEPVRPVAAPPAPRPAPGLYTPEEAPARAARAALPVPDAVVNPPRSTRGWGQRAIDWLSAWLKRRGMVAVREDDGKTFLVYSYGQNNRKGIGYGQGNGQGRYSADRRGGGGGDTTGPQRHVQRGGDTGAHPDGGGGAQGSGGVGRGAVLPEEVQRLVQAHAGELAASSEDIQRMTYICTAQLRAVAEGRKPAFLESWESGMRSLRGIAPEHLRYVERDGVQCFYNPDAVRTLTGLRASDRALDGIVAEKVASGESGDILGYGMRTAFEKPCRLVMIYRNGKAFTGFHAPAGKEVADMYGRERMKDFMDAFPADKWSFKTQLLP